MFAKVQDHPDLVRDLETNAILNTNQDALVAYRNRKKQANRIGYVEEKMAAVDQRLINIENLLNSLSEKLR
jgi:hypothetical protein